jgi:hypothetical protein
MHWDERALALVTARTIEGAIPWLVGTFRDRTRTSSGGYLYPVLTAASDGTTNLVLRKTDGTRWLLPL